MFYHLVPESPRYLCLKGQTTEAYDILIRAAVVNKRQLPSGILLSDQITFSDEELDTSEDSHLLSMRKNKSISFKASFSTVWMLFSSNLIKTTFLLWIVFFGNSFSYYGIILLTSELSSGQSQCRSSISLLIVGSEDSTYRDVFITSLAGTEWCLFYNILHVCSLSYLKDQITLLNQDLETHNMLMVPKFYVVYTDLWVCHILVISVLCYYFETHSYNVFRAAI